MQTVIGGCWGEQLKYKTNDIVIPLGAEPERACIPVPPAAKCEQKDEREKKKAIDHSSRCSTEAFICLRSIAASLKRHHREREEGDGASTATFVASRRGAAASATWLLPFLQTIFPPRSKTKDGIRMFYEHALQMRSGA